MLKSAGTRSTFSRSPVMRPVESRCQRTMPTMPIGASERVAASPSMAASFSGWRCATPVAVMSAEINCSSDAAAATPSPILSETRAMSVCRRLSSQNALTDATTSAPMIQHAMMVCVSRSSMEGFRIALAKSSTTARTSPRSDGCTT